MRPETSSKSGESIEPDAFSALASQIQGISLQNQAILSTIADMNSEMTNLSTKISALEDEHKAIRELIKQQGKNSPTPTISIEQLSTAQNTPASSDYSAPSTPPAPPAPQQSVTFERWEPEEIGYFNGTGNVHAFADRLRSQSELIGIKNVQMNMCTLFRGLALNWYWYEIPDMDRRHMNTAPTIDEWCTALIKRFGPSPYELIKELQDARYTRKEAANRKDATQFVSSIMRITRCLGWPHQNGLTYAFNRFEADLRLTLTSPTDLNDFIKDVKLRSSQWFEMYANYGKTRPLPVRPQVHQSRFNQNNYQSNHTNNQQFQRPQNQQVPYQPPAYFAEDEDDDEWVYDPPTNAYSCAAPDYQPPGPTPRRFGMQPRCNQNNYQNNYANNQHFQGPQNQQLPYQPPAYFAEDEDDGEWVYDAPSDTYIPAPDYQPPGHTPRRFGNTHDGGGSKEAWDKATKRCNGCTHYH